MSSKKDDTITVELDNRLEELFGSDDDDFSSAEEETESGSEETIQTNEIDIEV